MVHAKGLPYLVSIIECIFVKYAKMPHVVSVTFKVQLAICLINSESPSGSSELTFCPLTHFLAMIPTGKRNSDFSGYKICDHIIIMEHCYRTEIQLTVYWLYKIVLRMAYVIRRWRPLLGDGAPARRVGIMAC